MENIIGVKQLHTEFQKIVAQVLKGESFLVLKHTKPLFRIEPVKPKTEKKYTLADFKKLQFHGGDPDLSKKVDQIVYGI